MRIRKINGAILRAHQLQSATLVPLYDPETITDESEVVPPSITTTSLNTINQNQAVNQQLVATGTAPIIWSVSSGSLPDGLALLAYSQALQPLQSVTALLLLPQTQRAIALCHTLEMLFQQSKR